MDLLLDNDIILDLCRSGDAFAQAAIDRCCESGGRIWLYVGSVQTLLNSLSDPVDRQQLKDFAQGKHWLAALSGEADVFDAADPIREQLLRAIDRFPSGTIQLLVRDNAMLEPTDLRITSPTRLLADLPTSPSPDPPIPFIDLATQQSSLRPQLERNIHRVLHHGQYIMGPEVRELEDKLAAYVGVKHCITASSGTDTLLIAMMALGIGPGDEVITTPFTFIATGEMIALLGAKPVFVDIDPRTYIIDATKIEAAITIQTRAIMPVSLYGQCADMDAINTIAAKHNLPVIEDGAQSFGATYKGRRSCGLSTIGSTSFFPSKPLGCYGDGGALFTSDDSLAKAMREIRVHGQDRRYHHPRIGINGRLDTLQAAILLAKLDRFDQEIANRQTIAARYTELLLKRSPDLSDPPIPPYTSTYNTSVFAQYTISSNIRDTVAASLKSHGIPTAVHYPVPLHLQPAFASGGHREGDFLFAEAAAKTVLSLPMGPDLTESDQAKVVATVCRSCG